MPHLKEQRQSFATVTNVVIGCLAGAGAAAISKFFAERYKLPDVVPLIAETAGFVWTYEVLSRRSNKTSQEIS